MYVKDRSTTVRISFLNMCLEGSVPFYIHLLRELIMGANGNGGEMKVILCTSLICIIIWYIIHQRETFRERVIVSLD